MIGAEAPPDLRHEHLKTLSAKDAGGVLIGLR